MTSCQGPPNSLGSDQYTARECPLKSRRKESSVMVRPCSSWPGIALPFRKTPSERACREFQAWSVIGLPSGLNHPMSTAPRIGRPWNHRRRLKTAWSRRNLMSQRTKSRRGRSIADQLTQEISLSWQYALLLPFCVRPISSPITSIGTPCARKSAASRFLCCFARSFRTVGSSVSPSAPQFHDLLCDSPSRSEERRVGKECISHG